jgi:hypothetical protein
MKKGFFLAILIIIILSVRVNLLYAQSFVTQPSNQTICFGGILNTVNVTCNEGTSTPD